MPLVEELLNWRETEGMSDDARRKLFLMRKAADRIVELHAALREMDAQLCEAWKRLDDEANRVGDMQERVQSLLWKTTD